MTRTITDKLVARVVLVTDLGGLFRTFALKGRIGKPGWLASQPEGQAPRTLWPGIPSGGGAGPRPA